jgi:hypothetical protein
MFYVYWHAMSKLEEGHSVWKVFLIGDRWKRFLPFTEYSLLIAVKIVGKKARA